MPASSLDDSDQKFLMTAQAHAVRYFIQGNFCCRTVNHKASMELTYLLHFVPLKGKLDQQDEHLGCGKNQSLIIWMHRLETDLNGKAYSDKTLMQIKMLKLKHYSTFSWEEGNLGTPSTMLQGAGLTLNISFADKIANAHVYRPTEQKDNRGIFIRDAAVDESKGKMRSKSKLTCGWCELDPTISLKNSERSWANLSALLEHQHSGFHDSKPRTVYDTIYSHVAEQELAIEKTGGHHETTDTVPQQPVKFKNRDVSSSEGSEDGTGMRNLESPRQSKHRDSFSEVTTDRFVEQNQMPRASNEECNRPVPPSFASSEYLDEVPSDHNFLSPPEQGSKITYSIHEVDETSIGVSPPRSATGKFVEPNLIYFEDMTSEVGSVEDRQDPWMLFGESGGTLLDSP
ncbi:hypothetical protein EAE96_007927 [Botrytis aclada]|nr:hypothetical protein EAE96_007927 [Botrytis aclada]